MHLVHDIHLILARHGGILHFFAQIPHLVHAVIGSRVDLGNIEIGRLRKGAASRALSAGRTVYGMLAVDGGGENFGDTRLARAARTAKKIGVPDPARFYLIFQNGYDVLLPHHLVQRGGAESSV